LNAAGRLDTAELALAAFEERDPGKGASIARELSARNAERQSVERRVHAEARERIARTFDPEKDFLIVEGDPTWHRGVLGIAASRLAREYKRPVLLFALEGESAFGSGRSVPGVSLHDTLNEMRQRFREFGGHHQAVGGSLSAAAFPSFCEDARALFASRIPRDRFDRRESFDAELPLGEISPGLTLALARFEPHGAGNPRPVFSSDEIRACEPFRPLGETGWRGRLETPQGAIDAVCWNERSDIGSLTIGDGTLSVHYRVSMSRWSGRPEIEILRASPAEAPTAHPARLPPPVSRLPAPVAP
jgi:single-stranded-DNA-specific exonuclease